MMLPRRRYQIKHVSLALDVPFATVKRLWPQLVEADLVEPTGVNIDSSDHLDAIFGKLFWIMLENQTYGEPKPPFLRQAAARRVWAQVRPAEYEVEHLREIDGLVSAKALHMWLVSEHNSLVPFMMFERFLCRTVETHLFDWINIRDDVVLTWRPRKASNR